MRDFKNVDTFYDTQLNYGTYESIRKYYDKLYLKKIIAMKIANKRD